jgi:hypothetical protein
VKTPSAEAAVVEKAERLGVNSLTKDEIRIYTASSTKDLTAGFRMANATSTSNDADASGSPPKLVAPKPVATLTRKSSNSKLTPSPALPGSTAASITVPKTLTKTGSEKFSVRAPSSVGESSSGHKMLTKTGSDKALARPSSAAGELTTAAKSLTKTGSDKALAKGQEEYYEEEEYYEDQQDGDEEEVVYYEEEGEGEGEDEGEYDEYEEGEDGEDYEDEEGEEGEEGAEGEEGEEGNEDDGEYYSDEYDDEGYVQGEHDVFAEQLTAAVVGTRPDINEYGDEIDVDSIARDRVAGREAGKHGDGVIESDAETDDDYGEELSIDSDAEDSNRTENASKRRAIDALAASDEDDIGDHASTTASDLPVSVPASGGIPVTVPKLSERDDRLSPTAEHVGSLSQDGNVPTMSHTETTDDSIQKAYSMEVDPINNEEDVSRALSIVVASNSEPIIEEAQTAESAQTVPTGQFNANDPLPSADYIDMHGEALPSEAESLSAVAAACATVDAELNVGPTQDTEAEVGSSHKKRSVDEVYGHDNTDSVIEFPDLEQNEAEERENISTHAPEAEIAADATVVTEESMDIESHIEPQLPVAVSEPVSSDTVSMAVDDDNESSESSQIKDDILIQAAASPSATPFRPALKVVEVFQGSSTPQSPTANVALSKHSTPTIHAKASAFFGPTVSVTVSSTSLQSPQQQPVLGVGVDSVGSKDGWEELVLPAAASETISAATSEATAPEAPPTTPFQVRLKSVQNLPASPTLSPTSNVGISKRAKPATQARAAAFLAATVQVVSPASNVVTAEESSRTGATVTEIVSVGAATQPVDVAATAAEDVEKMIVESGPQAELHVHAQEAPEEEPSVPQDPAAEPLSMDLYSAPVVAADVSDSTGTTADDAVAVTENLGGQSTGTVMVTDEVAVSNVEAPEVVMAVVDQPALVSSIPSAAEATVRAEPAAPVSPKSPSVTSFKNSAFVPPPATPDKVRLKHVELPSSPPATSSPVVATVNVSKHTKPALLTRAASFFGPNTSVIVSPERNDTLDVSKSAEEQAGDAVAARMDAVDAIEELQLPVSVAVAPPAESPRTAFQVRLKHVEPASIPAPPLLSPTSSVGISKRAKPEMQAKAAAFLASTVQPSPSARRNIDVTAAFPALVSNDSSPRVNADSAVSRQEVAVADSNLQPPAAAEIADVGVVTKEVVNNMGDGSENVIRVSWSADSQDDHFASSGNSDGTAKAPSSAPTTPERVKPKHVNPTSPNATGAPVMITSPTSTVTMSKRTKPQIQARAAAIFGSSVAPVTPDRAAAATAESPASARSVGSRGSSSLFIENDLEHARTEGSKAVETPSSINDGDLQSHGALSVDKTAVAAAPSELVQPVTISITAADLGFDFGIKPMASSKPQATSAATGAGILKASQGKAPTRTAVGPSGAMGSYDSFHSYSSKYASANRRPAVPTANIKPNTGTPSTSSKPKIHSDFKLPSSVPTVRAVKRKESVPTEASIGKVRADSIDSSHSCEQSVVTIQSADSAESQRTYHSANTLETNGTLQSGTSSNDSTATSAPSSVLTPKTGSMPTPITPNSGSASKGSAQYSQSRLRKTVKTKDAIAQAFTDKETADSQHSVEQVSPPKPVLSTPTKVPKLEPVV